MSSADSQQIKEIARQRQNYYVKKTGITQDELNQLINSPSSETRNAAVKQMIIKHMFSPNEHADRFVRDIILNTIKSLVKLDDVQYEQEFDRVFQMPKLKGYVNRVYMLINHINSGAIKVDVLPNIFQHLDKLSHIGKQTVDGVLVQDQLTRLFTNTIASFINPALRNINLISNLVISLEDHYKQQEQRAKAIQDAFKAPKAPINLTSLFTNRNNQRIKDKSLHQLETIIALHSQLL